MYMDLRIQRLHKILKLKTSDLVCVNKLLAIKLSRAKERKIQKVFAQCMVP